MKKRSFRRRASVTMLGAGIVAGALVVACGWDPARPFERESPEVREAIGHLDGGDASVASELLETYLTTGTCKDGNIGTPPRVREKNNGSFDLGLALFRVAERFGNRFGDEEIDAGSEDPTLKTSRAEQITCAERIVRAIAEDPNTPVDLRARARYLEGNLRFLNGDYEDAVSAYDKALELAPGMGDAGPLGRSDAGPGATPPDPVGRDAAYNRAIALRRIEDKKDAGQDASSDASNDGGSGDGGSDDQNDGGNDRGDAGNQGDQDSGGGGGDDAGSDSGSNDDAGNDQQEPPKPPPQEPDAGAPPPPPPSKQSQDERMLDQLENAPTVQQEAARKAGERRKIRGIEDK